MTASEPGAAPAVRPVGPGRSDVASEVTVPIRRTTRTPAQQSVRTTVRLMCLGATLSVLAAVAEVTARDDIRASLVRENGTGGTRRMTSAEITDAADFTVWFMSAAAVLSAVLWLAFAWGIARGSHRARQIGTVLAVLCGLKVYGTVTQGGASTLGVLLDLAQLLVAVAVTVLVWSKRSSTHFVIRHRGDLG